MALLCWQHLDVLVFLRGTMSNCSQNCWIDWNSAVLCFKQLFHIWVWTFARYVRPLIWSPCIMYFPGLLFLRYKEIDCGAMILKDDFYLPITLSTSWHWSNNCIVISYWHVKYSMSSGETTFFLQSNQYKLFMKITLKPRPPEPKNKICLCSHPE